MPGNNVDESIRNVLAQRAYGSIYSSQYMEAQKSARANEVGRRLGVPADIVDASMPDMMNEDRLRKRIEETQRNATYAKIMANTRLAAAAMDDDHLEPTAKRVEEHVANVNDVTPFTGLRALAIRSLLGGVADIAAIPTRFAHAADVVSRANAGGGFAQRMAATNPILGLFAQGLVSANKATAAVANSSFANPQTGNRNVNDVLSGLRSAPTSAAALGATLLGGPLAGSSLIGLQTFGQSFESGTEAGLKPNEAADYAATDAVLEVATEFAPEKALSRIFGPAGDKGGKAILKAFGFEAVGEGIATATQGLNKWWHIDRHNGMTFDQFLGTLPDQERSTMVAVMTTMGLTMGTGHLVAKAVQGANDSKVAAHVDKIMEAAAKSPTRTANPSDFRDALNQVYENTNAQHLYIPAEKVQELFVAKEGETAPDIADDPFWKDYADQIDEAVRLGGDLIVPTADAITHLAGTPQWAQLREDVRYSAGGQSVAEAKTRQTPEEMQKIAGETSDHIEKLVPNLQLARALSATKPIAAAFGLGKDETNQISHIAASWLRARFDEESTARAAEGQPPISMDDFAAANLPDVQRLTQALYERAAAPTNTLGQQGASSGQEAGTAGAGGNNAATSAVPDTGGLRGGSGSLALPSGQVIGADQPLAGSPQAVEVPSRGMVAVTPHAPARAAAAQHMRAAGMEYAPPAVYAKLDKARAKRLADAFEAMKHEPNDPLVQAAYDQMIVEVLEQYQAIKDTGLTIEFIPDGAADPYAESPRLAILDVQENNHLWVFPTTGGFGQGEVSDSPMLGMTDEVADGRQLLVNDVFRIVHDYFGHIKDGHGFRAEGEENAWQSHAAMFSPLARRAMTSETRGQNSWVNYGPFGEANRKANSATTMFAPQKVGLLPEWASEEGYLGGDNGRVGQDDAVAGQQGRDGSGRADGNTLAQLESPPVNEAGEVTLVHFSLEENLDQTHPDAWGRSGRFLPNEERVRRKVAPPRTYFGIAPEEAGGYRIEFPIENGQRVHPLYRSPVFRVQAQFPLQNLYDMNADPDGLKAIGRALPKNRQGRYQYKDINLSTLVRGIDGESLYEHLIKDAGYDGYWIKNDRIGLVAAVFTPVDVTQVDDTFDQSAVDIQQQPLKVKGYGPGGQVTNEDMYHALTDRQRAVYGRELDPMNSEGDYKTVVRALVDEHRNQQETGDDGEGWYKEDVNRAIELTKEIFPELDDPMNRDMFLIVTAILSPKQSPVPNWDNAMHSMQGYFDSGRFALARPSGLEFGVDAQKTGLQILQHLVDAMGSLQAIEWLQSNHTGRELAEMRREVGVFKGGDKTRPVKDFLARDVALGDTVPGMAIFGPKVSNFAANVTGIDQSLVTVDSWAASTYNRIVGQLLKGNPQSPRGKAERKLMQRLFTDAANEVGISPSAMQAQLWYFEQRLYRNHGIDAPSTSFSEAAQKAALERGANPDRLAQRVAARESQNAGRGADALFTANGEPDQGTADPNTLNQVTPSEEVFYSNAQRAVEQAKMEKASPEQWKALLTPGRTPGIKAEEIEWTGIHDWLDMQKGSIDKAALLQVLRDRGIKVQEVVLKHQMDPSLLKDPAYLSEVEKQVEAARNDAQDRWNDLWEGGPAYASEIENEDGSTSWTWFVGGSRQVDRDEIYDSDDEAQAKADEFNQDDEAEQFLDFMAREIDEERIAERVQEEFFDDKETKFGGWSSDPSNDSYRELLITIPLGEAGNPDRAASTHWDTEGVVAHARFMDKTDAEGKRVLFIEEVQSDWHQKGRDQGYADYQRFAAEEKAKIKAAYEKAKDTFDAAQRAQTEFMGAVILRQLKDKLEGMGMTPEEQEESNRIHQAKEVAQLARREATIALNNMTGADGSGRGIPDAPFKSSWPALVMKRMIRYAAENGYDKVAWTTGEEQAARYNLSQAVGSLTLEGMQDSSGYRVRMGADAAFQLSQQRIGEIVEHNGSAGQTTLRMTEGQMREAFGNDIAQHLLDSDGETLSDTDLRVGGNGMRAFYDRNLVNITNDLIKKYGGKVGQVAVKGDDPQRAGLVNQLATKYGLATYGVGSRAEADERIETFKQNIAEGVGDTAKAGQWIADLQSALPIIDRIEAIDAKGGVDHPGFTITPELRDAALGGMPLFQQKRGNISFNRDDNGMMTGALIRIFESGNFSTAVHELGHFFLEDLRNRALRTNATPQARADWETYKAWVGSLGQTVEDNSPIPRDAHEYFARGVEAFVREGKAPSKGLRAIFTRAREFMLKLYATAEQLNAPITPEIREVMGRLFASQQEIDAQTADMKASSDAIKGLMTDAEQQAYDDLADESKADAYDKLLARVMSGLKKDRGAEFAEQKRQIKAEVEDQLNAEPDFRALRLLRVGVPDAQGVPQRATLSPEWLVDTYGPDILNQLPKGVPPIVNAATAMDADTIASLSGFDSGDAMVKRLVAMEAARAARSEQGDKRSEYRKAVEDNVTARMADEVGDPFANLEEEARAAIANDRQGDLMAMELRALQRKTGKRMTLWKAAKEWAAREVMQATSSEMLSGRSIQLRTRAAAKAGQNAEDALAKGKFDEAFTFKQQQLVNMALVSESKKAKELVEAAVKRMGKIAKRTTSPTIDQDYLEQAQAILEDVDLKERSGKAVDKIMGFADWHKAQVDAGVDVMVPPSYRELLGKTHYTKMGVGDLLELDAVVSQIIALGRLKQRLMDGKDERDFADARAELIDSGLAERPRKVGKELDEKRSLIGRVKSRLRSVDAAMIKVETLCMWLDGNRANGPWTRMVFNVMAAAQGRSGDLTRAYVTEINEHIQAMPPKQVSDWERKVDVPELVIRNPEHTQAGAAPQLRKDQIVMMALNWGNEGNRQRLADGYGWAPENIQIVLDRLMTKEDWEFVNKVWLTVDKLWPEIEQLERRVNGVAPERVEATEVHTPFGTFRGGYFPVSYDVGQSSQAQIDEANKLSPEGGWHMATTRSSATKARSVAVKNRPILLSMNVITRHLGEVIHDVTHREAVMQVRKLLADNGIASVIRSRLGNEYLDTMKGWMENIARPNVAYSKSNGALVAIGRHLNKGISLTGLGFRITTVFQQLLGFPVIIGEIGQARLMQGIATVIAHPVQSYNEVTSRSAEMRNRWDTLDASIEDMVSKASSGKLEIIGARGLVKHAFDGILYMDMVVTLAGWTGAFNKALNEGMNEDEAALYADKVVRHTQGAGGQKDRSAILYDHPIARSFYPFFSYLNALYNQQRDVGHRAVRGDLAEAARRGWWMMIVPMILQAAIFGQGPDDPDGDGLDMGDWARYLTLNAVLGNLGALPGVSAVATALGQGYSYRSNAYQAIGEGVVRGVHDAKKAIEGEDTIKGSSIKSVLNTIGMIAGQPLGQIGTTAGGLYDVSTGEADPQSASDWWGVITKGRVPEEASQ